LTNLLGLFSLPLRLSLQSPNLFLPYASSDLTVSISPPTWCSPFTTSFTYNANRRMRLDQIAVASGVSLWVTPLSRRALMGHLRTQEEDQWIINAASCQSFATRLNRRSGLQPSGCWQRDPEDAS
jgi:hypothetical protein